MEPVLIEAKAELEAEVEVAVEAGAEEEGKEDDERGQDLACGREAVVWVMGCG